jgi:hypothetical protein
LQAAEIRTALTAIDADVVATYRGAPAAFVDDSLHAKAGKIVGHIAEALLDVLGKSEAILRVSPLAFLFAERFGGSLVELRRSDLLAALTGSL